ncbi:hypothetical protein F8M41_001564 [Gigaspora margarita]|uniref:Uncharacterized protein n=1 Tax=Gigaspora margarita TaxID=4874 RepID=A0A8H3XGR7_GIGMA|nr:hypothetical protein F8M41_001564 [Gigaspora margarita]
MVSFININSDTNNTFEEVDFDKTNDGNNNNYAKEIAYFTKNLTAQHIQFSAISVEYSPTYPEGHMIIYNFIKSKNYSQLQNKSKQ